MNDSKRTKLMTVILFGLCALIWSIKAIIGIVEKEYADKPAGVIIDIVCSCLWIVCFICYLIRYRRSLKGE